MVSGSGAAALNPEAVQKASIARAESTGIGFTEDRFLTRARALFYARIALLTLGPPLLTVPAVLKLERVLFGSGGGQLDGFVLLWYAALNCILVYLMVYLNERDRARHRDLRALHRAVREVAVAEERNRLSREIHDGLGGVLSAVVIQSEYLLNMIDGSEIRAKLSGNTEVRAAIVPTP